MKNTIATLDDSTFDRTLAAAGKPALVEFGATWCPPCRAIEPHLAAIAAARDDIALYSVDADDSPDLSARFGVRALPTLVILDVRAGRVLAQLVGAQPRAKLDQWIDAALASRATATSSTSR